MLSIGHFMLHITIYSGTLLKITLRKMRTLTKCIALYLFPYNCDIIEATLNPNKQTSFVLEHFLNHTVIY